MENALLDLIGSFTEAMDGSATTDQLREIRVEMDSWLFRENVRQSFRGVNSRERIGAVRDALRQLQREAEALMSKRDNWRELFRIAGIGGGIGLAGSAVVTALTAATPAILILPFAGTVFVVWQSVSHSN